MNRISKILLSISIILVLIGLTVFGYCAFKIYDAWTTEEQKEETVVEQPRTTTISIDNKTDVIKSARASMDSESIYIDIVCSERCLIKISIYEDDLLVLQYGAFVREDYRIKYSDYLRANYLVVLEEY